jgi:hypothetical protein
MLRFVHVRKDNPICTYTNRHPAKMASKLTAVFSPALTANNQRAVDGKVWPCQNAVVLTCKRCKLAQVCCNSLAGPGQPFINNVLVLLR